MYRLIYYFHCITNIFLKNKKSIKCRPTIVLIKHYGDMMFKYNTYLLVDLTYGIGISNWTSS